MLPSIYVSLTLMEAEISKITVLIVQVLGHHGKRLIFKKKQTYRFLLLMEALAHNFSVSEHPVSKTCVY